LRWLISSRLAPVAFLDVAPVVVAEVAIPETARTCAASVEPGCEECESRVAK
jgi:hypothetical protein